MQGMLGNSEVGLHHRVIWSSQKQLSINNIYDDQFSGKLGDHQITLHKTASNKDISYFPSYEMLTNNKNAWMDDLRHVKG